ncbi:hypothetical protein ALP29_200172 [Pseudomonas syringae pv. avii]|uniref:Uncharacterized protein n=1 Tax=Pseudomonas syringae pv. avii TaxID=663959 RepID=A0A3M5VYS5_PSESX|nr:hypothetical protein ALP29_200172 [Pseudomonas syringae pv. avii]
MGVGGVHQRDLQRGITGKQACGGRYTGSTATDNQDLAVSVQGSHRRVSESGQGLKSIERDLQIDDAVVIRLGKVATAHVDLHCR